MKTLKLNLIVFLLALLMAPAAFAYYSPSTGRWLSRDPTGELGFQNFQAASLPSGIGNSVFQSSGRWIERDDRRGANGYTFVQNVPVIYFDVLGLWRSYEHRAITHLAWDNGDFPNVIKNLPSIYSTIEDENIAVDSGASANDLAQHYNRPLDGDIDAARRSYSANLAARQTSFDIYLEHPSKSTCKYALIRLGQLSHSWEDYYAHAIGVNSPFRGDPGPIHGNPDNPSTDLKPSSWGGLFNWGEHGESEPAWREPDGGDDRNLKAVNFVEGKFNMEMPVWWKACKCYYDK